jgi:hypothetical protein
VRFFQSIEATMSLSSASGAVVNSARVGLRECWIGGALAAYLLVRFAPQINGLSPQGQAVLGAMAVGAILWISEATLQAVSPRRWYSSLSALSPSERQWR